MKNINCTYCGKPDEWVENKTIYGRNFGSSYMMWLCRKCDAYVGCHQNTKKPLGTIANRELREMRKKVHAAIDPYWKGGSIRRPIVYRKLSDYFGKQVHVGESNIEQCKEILNALPSIFSQPKNIQVEKFNSDMSGIRTGLMELLNNNHNEKSSHQ